MYGSIASPIDEVEIQETSVCTVSTVKYDTKNPKRNKTCEFHSSKSPKWKCNILNEPVFSTSNVMPSILKPSSNPASLRDDSLTSQLSAEDFEMKPQSTSLYTVPRPNNFQPNPNRDIDHSISYEQLALYGYWISNI